MEGILPPPPPRGLCCLMAAVSIPLLPGDRLVATSASTSVPLARRRWDHYFTAAEKEVTLEDSRRCFSFCARWSCVFERLFLLLCKLVCVCVCVCVRADQPPRVLNRIYSARAGTSQTLHSMSAPCRKKSP